MFKTDGPLETLVIRENPEFSLGLSFTTSIHVLHKSIWLVATFCLPDPIILVTNSGTAWYSAEYSGNVIPF